MEINVASLPPLHDESTLRVGTDPSQYGAQFTMHVDLSSHHGNFFFLRQVWPAFAAT
jgi:hypothetical protein